MVLIVAAGQIWMEYMREQPDLHAAGRRTPRESENAIVVACCVFGMVFTGLAIVGVATATASASNGRMGTALF
jgi:hypothetical protein